MPDLIELGYAPSDVADKRLRRHELTEIGIRHSLFVADIHARMIALTHSDPQRSCSGRKVSCRGIPSPPVRATQRSQSAQMRISS